MKIIAIAAMTKNDIIATDGQMPWSCPEDMKHFRQTTTGYPVIMGRKTFEDMGGKPLPNRFSIVLSNQQNFKLDFNNCRVVDSLRDAIFTAYNYCDTHNIDRAFVIGGEQIYKAFAPHVDKAILTFIDDKHVNQKMIDNADKINFFPLGTYLKDVKLKNIQFLEF